MIVSEQSRQRRRREAPQRLRRLRQQRGHVTRATRERWGAALDAYDLTLDYALELGSDFKQRHHVDAMHDDDPLLAVLMRLYDKTCHVASEVRALLGAGQALGALARWRTMHELAVVALFIQAYGRETAERYLRHDAVERWKWAKAYQKYARVGGVEPLAAGRMDELAADRAAEIAVWGSPFREQYGWAAAALDNDKPSLLDLEAAIAVDASTRWWRRTAYFWAHAPVWNATFDLDLPLPRSSRLIEGRGTGLAVPGELALNSLQHGAIALTRSRLEDDAWVIRINILQGLVADAAAAFAAAEQQA